MAVDYEMEVKDQDDAERELDSTRSRGRTSRYDPVAQKWAETENEEAIVLRELEQNDIQNLRNLLYRKFGKRNVIVRSVEQEEGDYLAVVRERDGDEYLRSGE